MEGESIPIKAKSAGISGTTWPIWVLSILYIESQWQKDHWADEFALLDNGAMACTGITNCMWRSLAGIIVSPTHRKHRKNKLGLCNQSRTNKPSALISTYIITPIHKTTVEPATPTQTNDMSPFHAAACFWVS